MTFLRPGHAATSVSPAISSRLLRRLRAGRVHAQRGVRHRLRHSLALSGALRRTTASRTAASRTALSRAVTNRLATTRLATTRAIGVGLPSLCALGFGGVAHAKPFKPVGVQAWTSGSQTFIRARPGANVPPVAKVPRHTPLYVWGKFDGWYRVETHDHIFGWVYNEYINSPGIEKVREMPRSKARVASNRTANQTMYGSPALLQKHFVSYQAPGALRGLKKQGVYLAAPKTAKPKVVLVHALQTKSVPTRVALAPRPKAAAPRAVTPRVAAPKARFVEVKAAPLPASKTPTRLALHPRERVPVQEAVAAPQLTPQRRVPVIMAESPVPMVESPRVPVSTHRVRVAVKPQSRTESARVAESVRVAHPVAKSVAKPVRVAAAPQPARSSNDSEARQAVIAPAINGKRGTFAGQSPRISGFQHRASAPVDTPAAPEPRSTQVGRIARAPQELTPAARRFARAAEEVAARPAPDVALAAPTPIAVAPQAPVAARPIVAAPVVRAPRAAKAVAPKKVVAKKPVAKKAVAKARPKKRYSSWKETRRRQLRTRMGLSPAPMPPTVIAPVSPSELLKARNDYLNARKARLESPAPAETVAPSPETSLGGPSEGNLAPAPPAAVAPMSWQDSGAPLVQLAATEDAAPTLELAPLVTDAQGRVLLATVASSQLKPNGAPLSGVTSLAPMPLSSATMAPGARGGSPLSRLVPLRGGSPRDRFGTGLASQALSYRGMPYIRGAASPSRGFDCSGLVYYLLRQRGYHPPRTAAGYRDWGTSVPRGQWQPGDLVLFANTYKRGISHIGVYLKDGKFVHAATSGTGVRVSSLNEAYYAGKYFGARRAK